MVRKRKKVKTIWWGVKNSSPLQSKIKYMKVQINQLGIENQNITIEEGSVYIELNGYTYYFDSSEDETIIRRWETDNNEDYSEEPKGWKDCTKVDFKFLTK